MAAGNARTHVLLTLGVLFTIGGASRILPSTFAIAEDKTAAASAELDADALQASYVPADTDAADAVDKICLTGETAEALAKDQEALDVRVEAIQEQELSLQLGRKSQQYSLPYQLYTYSRLGLILTQHS